MIKKIFSLMLLCTTVLFASCKDDDNTIEVGGVSIDPAILSLELGKTATLNAIVTPENADTELQWNTSSAAIASIDEAGVVTAVAVGEATITVTTTKGGKTATCKITVEDSSSYIKINGIKVATGNLVADGANGAKIGTFTDIGLYFQFGSLIGWSNSGVPTIVVKPLAFNGNEDWKDSGKVWQGTSGVVPFTATGSDEEKAGVGDPCRYYLKDTWRLPTKEEFKTIFDNTTNGWKGATSWTWTSSPAFATHTSGLKLLAPGGRQAGDDTLISSGLGVYWSASPDNPTSYNLTFYSTTVTPNDRSNRRFGYSVRCVKD